MTYDIEALQADGAQETRPRFTEWARGLMRIGRFDYQRADEESQEPGHIFHDQCGYAWPIHDNRDSRSLLPFGCPPDEATAQLRWGYGEIRAQVEREEDRVDAVVNGNG